MSDEQRTEGWTIAVGEWPGFQIVPARSFDTHSDERLNGVYPTRLAAIERVISNLEQARLALAREIARAKRMKRAAS